MPPRLHFKNKGLGMELPEMLPVPLRAASVEERAPHPRSCPFLEVTRFSV